MFTFSDNLASRCVGLVMDVYQNVLCDQSTVQVSRHSGAKFSFLLQHTHPHVFLTQPLVIHCGP